MAALLTIEAANTNKLAMYLGECRDLGVPILAMLGVRNELGRIDSLYTLCEQVDQRLVNKRPLESLVKAGAFDSLVAAGTIPSRRARLFAAVDKAIEHGSRHQRDRDKGQSQLFGGGGEGDAETGGTVAL